MTPDQRALAEGILYTDQYQLTMAQLYFRHGLHERAVLFDHFYRRNPDYGAHQAGFCINAGMEWLLDWMEEARCTADDIASLRSQRDHTGARLFADDFLEWLHLHGDFSSITMRAIPEGRVVHPNEPLTIVQGPMAMAQILETSLLNHLNYQTLIATKAARVKESGRGKIIMEFGLRRGQDRGANAAARAALIGGADFSSNVGVSHVLGYPPRGTPRTVWCNCSWRSAEMNSTHSARTPKRTRMIVCCWWTPSTRSTVACPMRFKSFKN